MHLKINILLLLSLIILSCSSTPPVEIVQKKDAFPNYGFEVYGRFTVEEPCNKNKTMKIGDLTISCDSSLPIYRGDEVYLLSKYPAFLTLKRKERDECDYGDLCTIFDLLDRIIEEAINSYLRTNREFASLGLEIIMELST